MLEVQEESQHAKAQQAQADYREIKACVEIVLVSPLQHEISRDNHDPGHQSSHEKICRDLPSPDFENGIDEIAVVRGSEFVHADLYVR
jgi:hypothetical protein